MGPAADPASDALAQVVREDWGRLLALLTAQYRRVDLAEESLGDAVEDAARSWPESGAPERPAAWLLTAARRRATDRLRRESVLVRRLPLLAVDAEVRAQAERVLADPGGPAYRAVDERLRLVLLCAHPELSGEAAAALTLRLVLGVPSADIARLFLVPVPTMQARLTRARRRLAGAAFEVPHGEALAARLDVVARVAYLAFTAGYTPGSGPDPLRPDLAGEAVRLVRVVREVLPAGVHDPELDALLALLLLQHSRRDTRLDAGGRLVLLPDQDRSRWDHAAIAEALDLLRPLTGAPGAPYLLQALIAAEHAVAPDAADTDWSRIVARYDELLALGDSPVVRLNRAVAIGEARGAQAGLDALDGVDLPGPKVPAARAELLARLGRADAARTAYDRALALTTAPAEREHLAGRRAALDLSLPRPPG